MKEKISLVDAQLMEGNVVIAMDAAAFAEACAKHAEWLHQTDPELAKLFLQAMGGFSLKIENCNPTHTTNYPERHQ